MKTQKKLAIFIFGCVMMLLLCGFHTERAYGTDVFINEIHYDNAGTDTGEAIEIAGPAGTVLDGWSIVLYNGSTGMSYDTRALSGTIPDQQNRFGTIVETYGTNGIQNGSPDGIALVDPGSNVIQFLSYEGSFTAVGGPADGMTSTDIGVSEPADTPIGDSLQLTGTGTSYEDFTWNSPSTSTFGTGNTEQIFPEQVSEGCTFTQGYWKTHSIFGPAEPYDPTWDLKGGGDEKFLSSAWDTGYTWYSIMWEKPKHGNRYIILAQQFIAAWLNINNANPMKKADPTDVISAMADAENLLGAYSPSYNWKKDVDGVRDQFTYLSNMLADFNEGSIGPGHCNPCIDIEKYVRPVIDADLPPGPSIPVGLPVGWRYVVSNCGNIFLTDVHVNDDQGVTVSCPKDNLAEGESMTCTGSDIAQEGQSSNTGTATGTAWYSTVVQDQDMSHYFGMYADEVIGETTGPITRQYRYESSMGDLVTDIMRAYAGADFAFFNSGGLRADMDAGTVTFGKVFSVLPFLDTVVVVALDGNEVLQVLEEGIAGNFGVIQVSGLKFTFDYDNPVGSRIIGDVIDLSNGSPLDPSASYHAAVNDFMAAGGDGYFTLAANPQVNTDTSVTDVVVDWIGANSPFTAPDPAVEQRITASGTPPW